MLQHAQTQRAEKNYAYLAHLQRSRVSPNKRDHSVRRRQRPAQPLILELRLQHQILLRHSRQQRPAYIRQKRDPIRAERFPRRRPPHPAFHPPSTRTVQLRGDHAREGYGHPEVGGVAYEGVRAVRDELVLFFDGELEGEVASEGLVAEEAEVRAGVQCEGAQHERRCDVDVGCTEW